MTASQERACSHRQQVHHNVLQGVAVGGSYANGSCPLMMCLVHQLVQFGMVEQPMQMERSECILQD